MRLDKAFRNTPPEVHYAIERAFQRGEAEMKKRHKIALALSMAACMAAMVAAALAVNIMPRRGSHAVPLSETGKGITAGDAIVYFTESGKYYHDTEDCSGMTGAREGTEREAWSLDKRPCPVCLGGKTVGGAAEESDAEAPETAVYYNKNGVYYHTQEHCSGMWNAKRHTVAEAEADGKQPCPVCVEGADVFGFVFPDSGATPEEFEHMTPDPTALPAEVEQVEGAEVTPEPTPTPGPLKEEAADEPVYYTTDGTYYHAIEDCSDMIGASAHTLAEAEAAGKRPCPACVFRDGPTLTPAPGEPASADALPVYYTAGGNYYHGAEDCSGMAGASPHTLAEAEAAGKRRCPVCQPLGEAPYVDLFRKAFGMEIGEVWPGFSYYYLVDMRGFEYEGERFWVIGRLEGDDDSWAYGAGFTVSGDGEVRLSLSNGISLWILEHIREEAPTPVSAILGADLDALARANGREFPGLKEMPYAILSVTFDASGNMKTVSLLLSDASDPGEEKVGYTAEWSAIDGGFQLDRIVDESDSVPDWDVPAGLVTVTG